MARPALRASPFLQAVPQHTSASSSTSIEVYSPCSNQNELTTSGPIRYGNSFQCFASVLMRPLTIASYKNVCMIAYASSKLLRRCNAMSGYFSRLSCGAFQTIVQIQLHPDCRCSDDHLFISPLVSTLLNLDLNPQPIFISTIYTHIPRQESRADSNLLPLARSVTLARVSSPMSHEFEQSDAFTDIIQSTLKNMDYLWRGLVFPVPLRARDSIFSSVGEQCDFDSDALDEYDIKEISDISDACQQQSLRCARANVCPLVFFRVASVEADYGDCSDPVPCRFDADATKVITDRHVSSRVPYCLESFLSLKVSDFLSNFASQTVSVDARDVIQTSSTSLALSASLASVVSSFNVCPSFHGTRTRRLLDIFMPSLLGSTEMPLPSLLLSASRRSGKCLLVSLTAATLGLHLVEINAHSLLEVSEQETLDNVRQAIRFAQQNAPCILHIRRFEALKSIASAKQQADVQSLGRDIATLMRNSKEMVLLVASCTSAGDVGTSLRSIFTHELVLSPPDSAEREQLLAHRLCKTHSDYQSMSRSLAAKTAGAQVGDLDNMCADLLRARIAPPSQMQPTSQLPTSPVLAIDLLRARIALPSQMQPTSQLPTSPVLAIQDENDEDMYKSEEELRALTLLPLPSDSNNVVSISLTEIDFALQATQRRASTSAALASIPNVQWADVGGLGEAKKEILDTIELPLRHPKLFASGLRQRSGLLLYGPPGTGKTLLAKAIATECSLNFISVKGPELLNMYVGESERNVRDVFERARAARPCVLFFDELDSVAPARGSSGSQGAMDRVVSQLLAELDGMNKASDVFIVGATNRPDLLDSALLRPGRLDRCVYLGVSDTHEQQLHIIKALTRKFDLAPDVDLVALSQQCPFNFSGADFYALCSDALLMAYKRKTVEVEERASASGLTVRQVLSEMHASDIRVLVSAADFDQSLASLSPSLSFAELQHYQQLRHQFQSGRSQTV